MIRIFIILMLFVATSCTKFTGPIDLTIRPNNPENQKNSFNESFNSYDYYFYEKIEIGVKGSFITGP
ncbi:MAG: hypothetical protein GTN59_12590 [Candidatus Dadabacteria bacterium]|nr:hypothetical protein [Candidatus Dadabacteria bacterium]